MSVVNHKQYLSNFETYLSTMSKSHNTIITYLSDLNQYFSDFDFDLISRFNIQQYKQKISNLAATTINRKLSALKQFNEYLLSTNLIDQIHIYKQDYTKIQEQLNPTNISEKTVLKFLDRVNKKETMYKSRNIAIIYLMANTGIRREECCDMMLSNINGNKMSFCGKGHKFRTVVLNKRTLEVIDAYLNDRIKHKYSDSPYLFISDKGEKLRKESINRIFDFYCTPTIKVTPHSLRHNWCSTMIEKGILTLKEVQNQAGHSSILTTDRYVHARLESIEQKINSYSIG